MNYTRKRALLACDFCRHRKRKCDGARPRCSTCAESNADCVYKELPFDRVESSSPSAVVDRLSRIEALLEEQGQRLNDLAEGSSSSSSVANLYHPLPPFHLSPPALATTPSSVSHAGGDGVDVDAMLDHAQFLIPADHYTSANSLLSLPAVSALVGEYPRSYFQDIEEALPLPPQLDPLRLSSGPAPTGAPALDPTILDYLSSNYFLRVHPNYPLFTQQSFAVMQARLFENGPTDTVETAICFCVYALGSIAAGADGGVFPGGAKQQLEHDELGMHFFQPALRIVLRRSVWGFRPTMELCQALLLAGEYLAHLGRPLHSWRLVYYASHQFMFLLEKRKRAGLCNEPDDRCLRVFWSCFMIECDRAAELDVPRSGIEPMADKKMPLPRTFDPDEDEDILYFVAETAVRRLLNRIHSSIYSADNPELSALVDATSMVAAGLASFNLNKLLTLGRELNRQLEEWYASIPDRIRPPIGPEPQTQPLLANDRGRVLRLHYYAARHIIHRPFVLYAALRYTAGGSSAASSPPSRTRTPKTTPQPQASPQPLPQVIQDMCEACLSSCRSYVLAAADMLDHRSPYLWTLAQGCLASLLVLRVADDCPALRSFTPDVAPLRALVVPRLRRWAAKESSLEAVAEILEGMTVRDRYPA